MPGAARFSSVSPSMFDFGRCPRVRWRRKAAVEAIRPPLAWSAASEGLRRGGGMGVRNYLIEGVSGAGKTAVAAELQRRGYQAIHGDRELAYRGDPQTGLPLAPPTDPPTARWLSEHQIWDVEKVRAHVASRDEPL